MSGHSLISIFRSFNIWVRARTSSPELCPKNQSSNLHYLKGLSFSFGAHKYFILIIPTLTKLSWRIGSSTSSWIFGSYCQESLKKSTSSPLSISQKLWSLTRCLFALATCHIGDLGISWSRQIKFWLGHPLAYLWCQKLLHGSPLCVTHRHQILVLSTWFAISGSLSPRSPFLFCLHIVSQSTIAHLCLIFVLPQRKFHYIALLFFMTTFGVARTENT